jgi:hypothetical protein
METFQVNKSSGIQSSSGIRLIGDSLSTFWETGAPRMILRTVLTPTRQKLSRSETHFQLMISMNKQSEQNTTHDNQHYNVT